MANPERMANPESHAKGATRLRKLSLSFAVLALVIGALFATGWPQRKAVTVAARYILNAEVDLVGITSIGAVHVDEVRIYDSASDRRANRPAFIARGVEVDYTLLPQDGRHLNKITIDSLHATLDATDPADTNYDFVAALFERETDAGVADTRFLPERVNVQYIHTTSTFSCGQFVVDGIGLVSDTDDSGVLNTTFRSNAVSGSWRAAGEEETTIFAEGFVDIKAVVATDRIEAAVLVAVPGLIEAEGDASVEVVDEVLGEANLRFSRLRVYRGALPVMGDSFLPMPVAFDLLEVSGLSVMADLAAERVFPEAKFNLRARALEVGEPGHALFSGDVSVEGNAASGETHTATARMIFEGSHTLELELNTAGARADLRASFDAWPKEVVERVAPEDLRTTLEALDYETLGGVFAIAWDDPTYIVSGNFQSSGSGAGAGEAIQLTVFGDGSPEAGPLFTGEVSAKLGEGSVSAKARVESGDSYAIAATLERVDVATWAAFLAQADLPEDLHGKLFGTVDLAPSEASEGLDVKSKMAIRPLEFGNATFEEVDITAAISVTEDLGEVATEDLHIETDGFAADVVMTGTLGDAVQFDGSWQAQFDLGGLGPVVGLDEVWGEAESRGSFSMAGDVLTAPVEMSAPFLGYGDLSTPYDTPITIGATIEYDIDDGTGAARGIAIRLGESASLQSDTTVFDANTGRVRGSFTMASDFYPAVAMEFIHEAEGHIRVGAEVDYSSDGLRLDWDVSGEAPSITLPEEAGALHRLSFTGVGVYDGEIEGRGTVSAERITVAGANVTGVETQILLQGEELIATELKAAVFNGRVSGRATAGILKENFPIRLNAQFESIDLAQLTLEVQPPSVELTGIAGGSAVIGYALEGLNAFTVDAYSDQDFSLNRSMVEQVLQTDQFREMLGSDRVEKALGKFLGDAPQRPFDSASLHLELLDGRIAGKAHLKSEKTRAYNGLNMDIELKIDPGALGEALKMLEEGSVANVEF